MTHWGWYWKIKKQHTQRSLCSSLVSIDSFKMHKDNKLSNGFIVKPLDIYAERVAEGLKISYRKRNASAYTIPVDKLSCNYGGFRYYFRCPLCRSRMRILYFAQNSTFLCRKCLNLAYESQRLRPTRRYYHMSQKTKQTMKDKGGNLDLWQKPKHMHHKTYQKLKQKQFYYESKSNQAINAELRIWYGPKIEPYLDTFFDYVDENKTWSKKRSLPVFD